MQLNYESESQVSESWLGRTGAGWWSDGSCHERVIPGVVRCGGDTCRGWVYRVHPGDLLALRPADRAFTAEISPCFLCCGMRTGTPPEEAARMRQHSMGEAQPDSAQSLPRACSSPSPPHWWVNGLGWPRLLVCPGLQVFPGSRASGLKSGWSWAKQDSRSPYLRFTETLKNKSDRQPLVPEALTGARQWVQRQPALGRQAKAALPCALGHAELWGVGPRCDSSVPVVPWLL